MKIMSPEEFARRMLAVKSEQYDEIFSRELVRDMNKGARV